MHTIPSRYNLLGINCCWNKWLCFKSSKKSGYEKACILYENCDDLIKKVLSNEQVPPQYTMKAKKLLYTVAKHRDFDHEALSKVSEETFNDIINC